MHDIKAIRTDPEGFDQGLQRRGLEPQASSVLKFDSTRRAWQTELQELQSKRNKFASRVGAAKAKGEDVQPIMQEARLINDRIVALEIMLNEKDALGELLNTLPNLPAGDVPVGKDETANALMREEGERPVFSFQPRAHDELGDKLGVMDFGAGANLSGARFVVLKGALARMERALASFMLDIHTGEFGYTEVVPPFLVRSSALYGTGQLPKFEEDLFETTHGLWLIPTAEVPLTNLACDAILAAEALPLRFVAYTPCFRSEAGSAGRDTRGMIRQHQFSKVELVSITTPDKSQEEHERMTSCAETILRRLGLAYRVMLLCSGDMGFSAEKTYDIEVWLPGQGAYREISSCSNCGAFQARRMKARYRLRDGKETHFVHTLNGSGLPIGRTMVAILENYQQEDGSILIPEALRPYMGGLRKIVASGD